MNYPRVALSCAPPPDPFRGGRGEGRERRSDPPGRRRGDRLHRALQQYRVPLYARRRNPTYSPPRNEAELSCDRAAPSYLHFSIGAHGPPVKIENPGEQPCCSLVPILAYGVTWKAGPFSCRSETTGLPASGPTGRGFLISRAKAVTF